MLSERGTRFDPIVLDAFFDKIADIDAIRRKYDDTEKVKQITAQKEAEAAAQKAKEEQQAEDEQSPFKKS